MRTEIVDYADVRNTVTAAFDTGDFAKVKSVLGPLARLEDGSRTASENRFVYSNLGRLYEEIQEDEDALKCFMRAYEFDSRDRHALSALARLLFEQPDSKETLVILPRLLVFHRYSLKPSFVASAYVTIAKNHQANHKLDAARTAYEKALEVTPSDMGIINSLLGVAEESGDPEAVQAVRERLLTSLPNAQSRAAVLVAMGDDYISKLDDHARANEAYERALAECATSVPALERIAKLAEQHEEFGRAVRARMSLGEVAEDVETRVKHLKHAAALYLQRLEEQAKAIEVFNTILDIAPREFEAFKLIDRLLREDEDWDELDKNYELMIAREIEARAEAKVLVQLYRALGELRVTHRDDLDGGAEALQSASDLVPDDLAFHQILAELYSRIDDKLELAVREHREILRLDSNHLESVDALAGLYRRLERFDESLCVFRVMDVLGRASEDGARIVERYSTHRAAKIEAVFDEDVWNEVRPPYLEPKVARIFGLAKPALIESFAHDLEHYNLREKEARFDLTAKSFFSNIYKAVIHALGQTELPSVYVDKTRTGMRNGYLLPPAFLVGADMLSGREEREIAFLCGKSLVLFRNEFFLTQFGGRQVLEGVLYTIFKTYRQDLNVQMTKDMLKISKQLEKKLKPEAQSVVRRTVSEVVDGHVAVNTKHFLSAAEDMANRVGFLFCDDLPTVRALLESETSPIDDRPVAERFGALLMWAISDEYMELRKKIGIAIG